MQKNKINNNLIVISSWKQDLTHFFHFFIVLFSHKSGFLLSLQTFPSLSHFIPPESISSSQLSFLPQPLQTNRTKCVLGNMELPLYPHEKIQINCPVTSSVWNPASANVWCYTDHACPHIWPAPTSPMLNQPYALCAFSLALNIKP